MFVLRTMLSKEKVFTGAFFGSCQGRGKVRGILFENIDRIIPVFFKTCFYKTLRLKHTRGKF
jgi:hypothetical protein